MKKKNEKHCYICNHARGRVHCSFLLSYSKWKKNEKYHKQKALKSDKNFITLWPHIINIRHHYQTFFSKDSSFFFLSCIHMNVNLYVPVLVWVWIWELFYFFISSCLHDVDDTYCKISQTNQMCFISNTQKTTKKKTNNKYEQNIANYFFSLGLYCVQAKNPAFIFCLLLSLTGKYPTGNSSAFFSGHSNLYHHKVFFSRL